MQLLIYKPFKYVATIAIVLQGFLLKAYAQSTVDPNTYLPNPPTGEDDLLSWVQTALNLAIGLSALVAVAVLIYGGIMYITSAGDEGKIETATKAITYSIIGLVICFISVLIVNFVLEYVIGGGGTT